MPFDLVSLQALLMLCAFWLLAVPVLSKDSNQHRAFIAIVVVAFGVRYLHWRLFMTIIPFSGSFFEEFWLWLVFSIELLAFFEVFMFFLVMSRTNTRTHEADVYERSIDDYPSVDIFIPTYNEGLDVLEKTIIGAKHIDYPNYQVWVLDDGRRDWLRTFCEEHGVGYITRTDNSHAKAGNLNNGIRATSGELLAVFDADFVPYRNFLRRTVGFFVHHEDVGIVQTPQHFFNQDPIQTNLYLNKVFPDEQRLFFDSMAASRDGWNASFCCGSCAVLRRRSIEEIGGIPTSSITEDLLTTLALLTKNIRTIYLNEKLSQGMSSESVAGYFIQRARWCRGGIQCFFVPEGPLRAPNLSFFQRLLFSPYGWVIQPLVRFFVVLIPVVYLWFGLSPLYFTTTGDIVSYLLPMLLAYALAVQWFAPRKYLPVLSTAVGLFSLFRLLPVVISSLIKPFGEPFRVTPKGAGSSLGTDYLTLAFSGFFLIAYFLGVMMNSIPEYRVISNMQFFPYAVIWGSLNFIMLFISGLLCFDAPRKRTEERFTVQETARLLGRDLLIEDLSVSGCRIRHNQGRRLAERGDVLRLEIKDIEEPLKLMVVNANATELMCRFIDQTQSVREALIVKLFTGSYDNAIRETKGLIQILRQLSRRAFGRLRE